MGELTAGGHDLALDGDDLTVFCPRRKGSTTLRLPDGADGRREVRETSEAIDRICLVFCEGTF